MYLPVQPGRLIEGPVNRGPENRGCTVSCLHGRPHGGQNGHLPPPGNGPKNQNFLEDLTSET